MKNVAIKGPAKAFMMSISNFFITLQYQLKMFTKIILSSAEQNALQNPEYILTKNSVIAKVYDLFGMLATHYRQVHEQMKVLPSILQAEPKISRGENYQGMPYVMLDFPRLFDKEHICAIRSFFWWGHYFSITLHLKGRYRNGINLKTVPNTGKQWLYVSAEDEWNHDLRPTNTLALTEENFDQIETLHSAGSFCKIAQKLELEHWDDAGDFFQNAFKMLLINLDFSHLNGE